MLQRLHRGDPEHFQRLASRVKSLCTVIQPDWKPRNTTADEPVQGAMIRFWQLLPFFKNLEKLELHGDISESEDYEGAPEITAPPLQLRVAKLFGYIPHDVAAWLLKSGNALEWLELGLLHWSNFPMDRDEELFPPPGDTSEGYDIDPNDEYFETVIPQPLVNFLSTSHDLKFRSELSLPRLKHLHLCQPCKGSYGTHEVSWSITAQAQCLSDWREILLACSDTLAVLVLEQRPSIDLRGVDEQGADEVKVLENDEDGGRHRALIKMVQRLFTSEEALKRVKQVYLYGMVVGQDELGNPTDRFASGRFMRLLESGGVKCEARQGHWFVYDEDYTEYAKYMDEVHGTEETEDNGEFDFMCKQTPFLARV
ncbi:hypothetical protein CEP53_000896 [Fusarium sp. AF-6]|nr:hypothetical protein CEP53_000896 [Fusarium sp. AF-6]